MYKRQAVGMSLGNMVLALTTGKKKYAEYQEEIEEDVYKRQSMRNIIFAT